MIQQLVTIADDLRHKRPVEAVTTRAFLGWFGAQRRGRYVVQDIRSELSEAGVQTVPDFEGAWIDGRLSFELPSFTHPESSFPSAPAEPTDAKPQESATEVLTRSWVSRDATYRVSKLEAANKLVVSIKPDATLAEAITLLLSGDFSQIPVMTGLRDVKGILTWKSIGARLGLGKTVSFARNAMDPHHEIRSDFSIFDAIPLIVANGYVLVRGGEGQISGIITASDLSLQFRILAEPFLLIGEIENLVRNMIGDKFDPSELVAARDPESSPRKIGSVSDMTFGEYIGLLENPDRWARLEIAIDRVMFCKNLDRVREIRNDVTHFDPDGITDDDLRQLREFTNFLKQLENVRKA